MKIGLSLSKCVIDLYENVVAFDDVLVVIASSRVDPMDDEAWTNLWNGYTKGDLNVRPQWRDYATDEKGMRDIVTKLYKNGRLHQPRLFGASPVHRVAGHWLELVHSPQGLDKCDAVQQAWDSYKTLANLTGAGMIRVPGSMGLPKEYIPPTPEEQEEMRKAAELLLGGIC